MVPAPQPLIGAVGKWTLVGGQMHIWPIMAAAIAGPPAVAAVTRALFLS
jgi:hypothetical protein